MKFDEVATSEAGESTFLHQNRMYCSRGVVGCQKNARTVVSLSTGHGMEYSSKPKQDLSFRVEGSTASYIHDTKHEKTIALIPRFDGAFRNSMAYLK